MAITAYTYSKQVNIITLREEIEASVIITIALNNIEATSSSVSIYFKDILPAAQETELIAIKDAHIYTEPKSDPGVQYDMAGKMMVHQSIRPTGFTTYWTGAGDDPSDITDVGHGQEMNIVHKIGEPLSGETIIYFNTLGNETWIYEGYTNWQDADMDCISLEVRSNTVSGEIVANGGTYDISQGIVLPHPTADGNFNILGDLTQHDGGLVEMPSNTDGIRPPGYWNADWNSTTQLFENITFNSDGTGLYNIFPVEVTLNRFVNHFTFVGFGTQELDSEDAAQFGHGMKLVLVHYTNPDVADHDWKLAINLTMHRQKTN
jgi:hypothetical protein